MTLSASKATAQVERMFGVEGRSYEWISCQRIVDRIDANFYAPEYLQIEETVKSAPYGSHHLGNMLTHVFKGAFYVLAREYSSTGIPFLRVADITKGYIDLSSCAYLPSEIHEREKKTCVKPGYLLFAKGGSIGNCAVVPDSLPEANISQDVIGASPKPELDSHFAVAFLTSRFGVYQMHRWIQRNTHPHLTNEAIRHIEIPKLSTSVQRSIGNKIRAAEKLRAESELSRSILHEWLNSVIPECEPPTEQMSVSPIFTSDLDSERLDAWFNHPRFRQLEQALNESSNLAYLETVATVVGDRWARTPGEIEYIEIGEFDLSQGTVRGTTIEGKDAPSRAQILANRGDVAVSLVRPNRQNIAFIPHRSLIFETSSKIWKFSFQRDNEVNTDGTFLSRLELWWQIVGQLSPKMEESCN